ncbi:hypothetical protein GGR57DRAFT_138040 [Xylariaceae sp. FL1272]|nr:hypothetical protein GGR57DRAFT_138040 [Xylariaceae sp. FL1272]
MNILLIWSILALLVAAFPVQPDHLPSPTIKSHNATTISLEARQRPPSPSAIPVSPPWDPALDMPPDPDGLMPRITEYNNLYPGNMIPSNVLSGYTPRVSGRPARPPTLFHQLQIWQAMNWGRYWVRATRTDPTLNAMDGTPLQSGLRYPRPFRPLGTLSRVEPDLGALNWDTDAFFEFPIGTNGRQYGVDFSHTPAPGRAPLPSATFVVFGFQRTDTTYVNPIYVGVINRRRMEPTNGPPIRHGRTGWCPIVNYDGTRAPNRNPAGRPWTGVPHFGNPLGNIWRIIRDWRPADPMIKQAWSPPGKRMEGRDQPQSADGASELKNNTQTGAPGQVR